MKKQAVCTQLTSIYLTDVFDDIAMLFLLLLMLLFFFYIYSRTDDDVCFKINASISSAIPVGCAGLLL